VSAHELIAAAKTGVDHRHAGPQRVARVIQAAGACNSTDGSGCDGTHSVREMQACGNCASEAVHACRDFARDTLHASRPGRNPPPSDNLASRRVAEKTGMQHLEGDHGGGIPVRTVLGMTL